MSASTPVRLLIADDEAAHMQALCDTLDDQGYRVTGCTSGQDALVALRQGSFDLLLADLMMPGMNGIALLREALVIDPTLVGIIMTGEGTIGSAVEAMQSGALDYILKPFKLSAILPVLSRSLAMRRLRQENAVLERSVRAHAAALETTNRELDAFTRSASHDLRAPLNIILGFSELLVSQLGPQIPPEQCKWLENIDLSARRMSELIDALMRLSYVGRQALDIRPVAVGSMVHAIVAELRQAQPLRQLTVRIGELPETPADASLLNQLFVNLLSNAFKFTRDTAQAVIEIGCEPREQERVFFVRDNGAGFDMARATRLFDTFQRFHGIDQFEGNGVGLSIVQRIVRRHGGRLWAEASVGAGATFYFTLGPGDIEAGESV
ncbi:MAG: response regulator [Burkholderiales bacterium]